MEQQEVTLFFTDFNGGRALRDFSHGARLQSARRNPARTDGTKPNELPPVKMPVLPPQLT
jgi:hypothetical protein